MPLVYDRFPIYGMFEIELGIIFKTFQQQVVLIGKHIHSLIPQRLAEVCIKIKSNHCMGLVTSHFRRLAVKDNTLVDTTSACPVFIIVDGTVHHFGIIKIHSDVKAARVGRAVPSGPRSRRAQEIPASRIEIITGHFFKTLPIFLLPSGIQPDEVGSFHKSRYRQHEQFSRHHAFYAVRPIVQYVHGTTGMRLISGHIPTQHVVIGRLRIAFGPLPRTVRPS